MTVLNQSEEDHKIAVVASTTYNMLIAESEGYYADQYWAQCAKWLPARNDTKVVLDLGCGQGRLANRIAAYYPDARVRGVDVSKRAVEVARQYASAQGLGNVNYVVGSSAELLRKTQPASVDVVLFTEVAFYHPLWLAEIPDIVARLRPGGIFIGSFRSAYFNVLLLLMAGRVADARQILKSRSGRLFRDSPVEFSWINSRELEKLMTESGLEILSLSAVGACSGIPGDPHASIARPGRLSHDEQELLMEIELDLADALPDAGRYVLAIARKPNSS